MRRGASRRTTAARAPGRPGESARRRSAPGASVSDTAETSRHGTNKKCPKCQPHECTTLHSGTEPRSMLEESSSAEETFCCTKVLVWSAAHGWSCLELYLEAAGIESALLPRQKQRLRNITRNIGTTTEKQLHHDSALKFSPRQGMKTSPRQDISSRSNKAGHIISISMSAPRQGMKT